VRREVQSAYSFCSASDPRVHLGLGTATRLESLEVTWIDGTRETVPVGPVDRVLVVRRAATPRR
jgi:hypothetical protein